MIEINLLPGAGRKSRGRGTGAGFASVMSGASSSARDPYLIGAMGSAVVAALIIGGLFFYQATRSSSLVEKEQKAMADSTRYAAVLNEKHRAEAQRDSVVRQLNIIRSIDNNRFVWPHVMDEVSRLLPPYTWVTSIQQTSLPVSTAAAADTLPTPRTAADSARARAAASDTTQAVEVVKFRIIGNTVDIQALTRFMTLLEQSAFVKNVQLARSDLVVVENKEVTQFQLEADYETPPPSAIRTVPVSISVR